MKVESLAATYTRIFYWSEILNFLGIKICHFSLLISSFECFVRNVDLNKVKILFRHLIN